MGHWSTQGFTFKMIELCIETLQGLTFGLRVSPNDLIGDVKARIYKSQGIPISQQHLVWNSTELDDEYYLQDYDIQDGATIKLVPTMRVGPINTRRIPIEEPLLRDCSDYISDANREEIYDKMAGSSSGGPRPLTVIVYQNGDQINLFRIVDRDAASPLSESLSNASMYGMCDEEEEEEQEVNKEKNEENEQLQYKIKVLRKKMDQNKKPKVVKKPLIPHPPSSGRGSGHGSTRPSSRSRLQRLATSSGLSRQPTLFNQKSLLPPVGTTTTTTTSTTSSTNRQISDISAIKPTDELVNRNSFKTTANTSGAVIKSNSNLKSASTESLLAKTLSNISGSEALAEDMYPAHAYAGSSDNEAVISALAAAAGALPQPEVTCPSLPGSASSRSNINNESAKLSRLTSVLEDDTITDCSTTTTTTAKQISNKDSSSILRPPSEMETWEAILRKAQVTARKTPRKWEIAPEVLLSDNNTSRPLTSGILNKDTTTPAAATSAAAATASTSNTPYTYKEPKSGRKSRGIDRLLSDPNADTFANCTTRPTTTTTSSTLEALKETLGHPPSTSSSKRGKGGGGGVMLESLNPSQVRAVSGVLNSLVNSSSASGSGGVGGKPRSGFMKDGRTTPESSRLMSARFRMSAASRDGHVTSAAHRLPPVKLHKKKPSKRCSLCNKKTGLATSYGCRCGNNFCATHRYAESHKCTFDYKTEGRKLLEQANPVVTAPKLPKI